MRLLIKFPTRNRVKVFKDTFQKYYDRSSKQHPIQFLITMDADDNSMNNQDIRDYFDSFPCPIKYCYGNSKSKIEAVNANLEGEDFDILLLASDDMVPCQQDYDSIIITKMQEHYPDLDGVLHFNDGRVGSGLNTLSIMGKKMYDRFGYIYHPDYKSLWCDNEFHEVTQAMGKVTYIDHVIIKHGWTDVTGNDHLARRNNALYDRDRQMFLARQAKGFPKESVALPASEEKVRDARWRQKQKLRRP